MPGALGAILMGIRLPRKSWLMNCNVVSISTSVTLTKNDKTYKQIKNVKNENRKQYVILEGFRQNGLHHWIQRIFLRIVAPVKNSFRLFFEDDIFVTLESLKTI